MELIKDTASNQALHALTLHHQPETPMAEEKRRNKQAQ